MIKYTRIPILLKHLTTAVISLCLAVLLAVASSHSQAGTTLDEWRIEISDVRRLAENDASRAHDNALRLQATIPSNATPADMERILNLLSRIEIYLAQTEQAEKHANQAMVLAKKNEDRIGQVEANLNIALNPINQVKIDDQFAPTIQSMELLREIDRPDLLVEVMLRTVMMDRRSSRSIDSITMSMKALEVARRRSTPIVMAYAYQGLAIAYDQSGKEKEAREQYTYMLEQARAVPSKLLEADALTGLGSLAIEVGYISAGEEYVREAIALYRSVSGPLYASGRISVLADILLQHGRPAAALPLFDEAIATQKRYGNKKELWWELTARSQAHQALGHLIEAQTDAEQSYLLANEFRVPPYVSESAKRLSSIAAARGDFRQAYRFFMEASEAAGRAERERVNTRMFELAKRYQSENQQINELKRLNKQHVAELKQNERQQRWVWTTLGGSIIILAGTAIFLLRLRRSHRQLENAHTQLQRFQSHQQAILDAIPDSLFELGLDGRYYDCHALHPYLLAAPVNDLLGKTVLDVMPQEAADIFLFALREAHEKGISTGRQFSLLLPQGMCWFELSVARKSMALGEAPHFIVLSRDITRRKQYDILEKARLDMLDKLSEDAPLAEVLMPLAVCVEQLHPDFLSSIMLLDVTGQHLYSIPVSSLSPDYLAAVDGILVGEEVGSCGTAAARGETVIVEDVREHPYWTAYKHLALQAGFLACWSQPILDSSGKVLGTFGIYRRVPGAPSALEMALVRRASHLAAIVIERRQLQDALAQREREFRTLAENSPDNIIRYDLQCRMRYVNPRLEKTLGKRAQQLLGKTSNEAKSRPDTDYDDYSIKIKTVLMTGQDNEIELTMPDTGEGLRYHQVRFVAERELNGNIVGVLAMGRDITELKTTEHLLQESQQLLRQLAARSEVAREDERKSLAREIHDELGQYLMALRMSVTAVGLKFGENNPALQERTGQLTALVDSTIQVVRNVVVSLRPNVLDMGIVPALEWLVDEYQKRIETPCELHILDEDIYLDDKRATAVFRIVQESLTNIGRHAKASKVDIVLEQRDGQFVLQVRDNGKGFDPAVRKDKSFGLVGMQERALMLGGELEITSAHGCGTAIKLCIPVSNVWSEEE